jgi:hypothetical protein
VTAPALQVPCSGASSHRELRRAPGADVRRRLELLREPLGVGVLAIVATGYVALVDPNRPGHYLVCPVYLLTGRYCAGCGALRATHDLVHGDIVGAWAMNPLWVVVAPLLVVAWLRWSARAWRGSSGTPGARRGPRTLWLPWVVLVVTLSFSVLRNVPALAPWIAP